MKILKIISVGIIALTYSLAASANEQFTIPTDPGVTYTVIHKAKVGDSAILATIRNSKIGGVSMSSRQFNCRNGTFKYLADEDGTENADKFMRQHNAAMENLNNNGMSTLTSGSISSYLYSYACKGG